MALDFVSRFQLFEAGSLSNLGIIDYDFEPEKQRSPVEVVEEKYRQQIDSKEEETRQLEQQIQFQMDNIKQIKYQKNQEQNH